MSDKDIGKQVASLGLIKKLVPVINVNIHLGATHYYLIASLSGGNSYYALITLRLYTEIQWCYVRRQCGPTVVRKHFSKHVVVDSLVGHGRCAGRQKQQWQECKD